MNSLLSVNMGRYSLNHMFRLCSYYAYARSMFLRYSFREDYVLSLKMVRISTPRRKILKTRIRNDVENEIES